MTHCEPSIEYTDDDYEVIIKNLTFHELRYLRSILNFRIYLARQYRHKVNEAKKEGKKARLSRTERSITK